MRYQQMTRASRGSDRLEYVCQRIIPYVKGFAGLIGLGVAAIRGIGFGCIEVCGLRQSRDATQISPWRIRSIRDDGSKSTRGRWVSVYCAKSLTAMERFKQLGVSGMTFWQISGMVAKFAASENISFEKAVRKGRRFKLFGRNIS